MTTIPILLLFAAGSCVHGARILGLTPMWAKSHHRFIQPILRSLAEAGHEVVVYTPFPLDNPPANYTDVHLTNIKTESEELTKWFLLITQFSHFKCFDAAWYIFKNMYREFIGDPKIKELLASKEHFDLIIAESFTAQEYTLLLGNKLKVPIIGLQAFPTNNILNSLSGNSQSLTFLPGVCSPFTDEMAFFERLLNAFSSLRDVYNYYAYQLESLQGMISKDFPDAPPLEELSKRVSLVFVNDHLTADYAQPRTPNIIPVAGIHILPTQPLPQDVKEFADGANEGLILFSLGTYVQDEFQPQSYFDMFNNVFKKLKQRVIWKTRKENILGLPENVMTMPWVPQQDILAHPNCKLFITHGGLHSQHEAMYFGVPVIGMPQFFDQHRNVMFFKGKGAGLKIETEDMSEKTIFESIQEVLGNSSYRDNMKRLSAVFRDRPLSPAESVVFWTEYVLRHGGAAHLRPASTELRWYQLALLDILSFVMAILLSIIVVVYYIVKRLLLFYFKRVSKRKLLVKKGN